MSLANLPAAPLSAMIGSAMISPLLSAFALVCTAAAPPGADLGPLGVQRQVAVGERLPRVLELLATEAGVVSPLQAGPFAAGRAAELVERLRQPGPVTLWSGGPRWADRLRGPLRLGAAEAAALDLELCSFALFTHDRVALQLALQGGPEIYLRGSELDAGPAWDVGARQRQPVAALDTQFVWPLLGEIEAWGGATVDLAQDPKLFSQARPQPSASNIVPLEAIDLSLPHRALVGVGGPSWSLNLGRDRLSLGNGRMGNLLLGDSADFSDFARAQLFLPAFTWTSLVVQLDPVLVDGELELPGMQELRAHAKHLVVHRAELVLLEKLHLAVSEGWLVGGEALDLRHLNPLLIYHNQFGWNDVPAYRAGSVLVTFEATLVPVRGVRLWGQVGINQLQTTWEQEQYPDASATIPDATGWLAGLELSRPIALFALRPTPWAMPAGVLHLFAGGEIVQTDPWFGVRENPLVTWSSRRQLQSNLPGGTNLIEQPLGWRFGPDSRVWRVWLGGLDLGLGQVELGFEQRLQGEQTLRTVYQETAAARALQTPTGTAEQIRVLSVQAELWLLRRQRWALSLHVDGRHFWVENLHHIAGRGLSDDQLVLGLRAQL